MDVFEFGNMLHLAVCPVELKIILVGHQYEPLLAMFCDDNGLPKSIILIKTKVFLKIFRRNFFHDSASLS